MNIIAILFDMDGVLIDAKEWHYEALNLALNHFGYNINKESHLSTFDGLPTKEKLKMLSKVSGLPVGLHDLINTLKQKYTIQISMMKCAPIFHHKYALSRLKSEGYKLAVCSNSVKNSVITMMSSADLMQYLEFVISNEDVEISKPNPEMYNLAVSKLNLSPKECLILEDNEHGIKAAMASGCNLLKIGSPEDVTYNSILKRIKSIELQGI